MIEVNPIDLYTEVHILGGLTKMLLIESNNTPKTIDNVKPSHYSKGDARWYTGMSKNHRMFLIRD